jgi:hypothetical protein
MVTGENSGTWGDKTNTNLNLVQQAVAGYEEVSIAGGAQTTTLVMTNATLSNARNAIIKFTGTITGNQIVTIPDGIEKTYILQNGTTGSFTVQFKTVSGTGVTFATTDKGFKQVFSDGTNVVEKTIDTPNIENDAITTAKILDGEVTNAKLANDNITINGTSIDLGASGNIVAGTDWQAVKTANYTASAGEGIFANTSGGAWTLTLPASPSQGDEVSFIDYAGTFDTNNLTIGRNGNPIQGTAADLTVSTERAANTLVYVDGTQGWLLKVK